MSKSEASKFCGLFYQLRSLHCLMYGDGRYQEWLIVGSEFNLPYDSVDLMELEGKVSETAPQHNW